MLNEDDYGENESYIKLKSVIDKALPVNIETEKITPHDYIKRYDYFADLENKLLLKKLTKMNIKTDEKEKKEEQDKKEEQGTKDEKGKEKDKGKEEKNKISEIKETNKTTTNNCNKIDKKNSRTSKIKKKKYHY